MLFNILCCEKDAFMRTDKKDAIMHIYIEIKVDAFIRIHKEDGQKKHIYKYLHRGHIKVDGFIRIHND